MFANTCQNICRARRCDKLNRVISASDRLQIAGDLGMSDTPVKGFVDLTAHIVSAYVSHNTTPASEIPALIGHVHAALVRISGGHPEPVVEAVKPAVAVKKSVTPDYIICLEDGKKFKSLKRHLRAQYNMTPEQ